MCFQTKKEWIKEELSTLRRAAKKVLKNKRTAKKFLNKIKWNRKRD